MSGAPRRQAVHHAAIKSAGQVIAAAAAMRDALPPRQAAELAWTATGPSVDELEQIIRSRRSLPRAAGRRAA